MYFIYVSMLSSKRRIIKAATVRDRRYSVPCPNTHARYSVHTHTH